MDEVYDHLAKHDFPSLFIEAMGWDRASRQLTVEVDEQSFDLTVFAEKRGFQVATCSVDRYTLFNRGRLRRIQKAFARSVHEHILISHSDNPAKQVWQWAVRLPDGRRLRHREHPFFSEVPPEPLLARIRQLVFSLDEEESITLVDVLTRVRAALDTRSELNLFVRKPVYAVQGDQLALAMRDGGLTEFHDFVLFHRPLANWATQRLRRWPGLDEEDAEQIGLLGVMHAARKFKPELGYQFSTYATTAIKRRCYRHGPNDGLLIRVPPYIYWPHWHIQRAADRLDTRRGLGSGSRYINWLRARDTRINKNWTRFQTATRIESVQNRTGHTNRVARRIPDPNAGPCERLISAEKRFIIDKALSVLPAIDGLIIRLRYGIDGEALTLAEVGKILRVTRERVRQRQLKAEIRLAEVISENYAELNIDNSARDDADETQEYDPANQATHQVSTSAAELGAASSTQLPFRICGLETSKSNQGGFAAQE